MIIVAGSHRIQAGKNAESIYRELQFFEENNFVGCACSPIFCPDGKTYIEKKIKKSKWEPNLLTPETKPQTFRIECREETISISVIPCIDSLHTEIIGGLLASKEDKPDIVVCPSDSPSVSLFTSIANLIASSETIFCYVNSAVFGGSFYNIPDNWKGYLKGYSHFYEKLPSKVEGILELIVNHQCFCAKKGAIDLSPICYHPFPYPVIYSKESEWLSKVNELKTDLIEWIKSSDIIAAIDWTDIFLSENLSKLPLLVGQNVKYIRHNILPLYDGNDKAITKCTSFVIINNSVDNTLLHWAIRVNDSIDILSKVIKEVPDRTFVTLSKSNFPIFLFV